MIDGKKVLGWIPARGGSKGIKDKNIKLLQGKPLIAYTIESACKSKYIDTVLVSTDSERIADIAKECGAYVPFLRPKELASDTAKTIDAVMHTIMSLKEQNNEYTIFCLLQPTSPLRNSDDIDGALETFVKKGCKALASVSLAEESPLLIRSISGEGELIPLLNGSSTCRRQDMPEYYKVNGAIYINLVEELDYKTSFNDNSIPFFMEKSHGIDIDNENDFRMAEWQMGIYK